MILSFPHMGKMYMALEQTCRMLDISYVIPSRPGPQALKLGQDLAPEGSCLPFSLVLGNMREGLDKGADTLLMLGGSGPCRFGYFVYLGDRILRDAGYEFTQLVLDRGHYWETCDTLRKESRVSWRALLCALRYGWHYINCAETLDCVEREYTARVKDLQSFKGFLDVSRQELENAVTECEVEHIQQRILEYLKGLSLMAPGEYISIGLVGDIYTLLEEYANQGLEHYLLERGVALYKDISVSNWFPRVSLPWKKGPYRQELLNQASPYLRSLVGGFGLESVAYSKVLKNQSVDGIIQLFPMGCMPEIVARSALNKLGRDEKMPILSITMEEHDSVAGFHTRIEAFLDMISRGKKLSKDYSA